MAMATKNVRTTGFEGIDKLPSNTLKRHPKMELNKNDLLRLLSYLEGELQARDVVIAALKAEKAKQLLYQAKYGRFGLGDPFHAMQRDSDSQKDNSFDEAAVKAMYDNQLMQLENLIATQRKAQQRMREQLAAVEKRYHKVCAELEEEKRKHAQDTAQGDDVTYMLEKDRERLKNEVDFEKSATKKLEKELKKTNTALDDERAAAGKHKQVAIMLIKERKRLFEKLVEAQRERSKAEVMLASAANKNSGGEGASDATLHQRLQQMEAAMERQLSEFDIEREQSRAKLHREEKRNRDLEAEVEQLRQQIELITRQLGPEKRLDGPQSIEIKSTQRPSSAREVSSHKVPLGAPKVYRNTPPNTPPEVRRIPVVSMNDSPERDTMSNHLGAKNVAGGGDSAGVKRAIMQFNSTSPTKPGERTVTDKPVPAEKPSDLTSRVVSSGGTVFTSQSGGTTVFTTPSGTRISLNVGPSAASGGGGTSPGSGPRKTSPIARGTPPPVPPNKPAYVPQAVPRKDGVRPSSAGSPRMDIPVIGKPAPPTKFGITISKDKITISSPDGHNSTEGTGSMRPVTVGGSTQRAVLGSHHQGTPPPGADRKPSQPASSIATSTTNNEHDDSKQNVVAQSSDYSQAAQPNLDFFGPEMADLQQLLVSMTTGNSSEGGSLGVNHNHASPVPAGASSPQRPVSLNVSSSPEVRTSTLHQCATSGDATQLRKMLVEDKIPVYTTTPDGTSALHCAAEAGNQDCVLVLLENGADPNAKRSSDHVSPVHAAAGEGHANVLKILIENGGNVERVDQSGWTPLHWASTNGHRDVCLLLLDVGSSITATTNANWTPLHCAVHSGHVECLDLLLSYQRHSANQNISTAKMVCDVINMADTDGWTITHLAATRESKECLEILMKHCELDLDNKDRWGRTVMEVASKECLVLLQSLERKNEKVCTVSIEIPNTGTLGSMNSKALRDSVFNVGNLLITMETSWSTLEELLSNLLTQHFQQANVGLRTKKTARLEQDSTESNGTFTLGLSQDSVKYYSIGEYRWSPGTVTDASPFSVLSANCTKHIHVGLLGWEDGCLDALAYESLISIVLLNNYLRLVEQYKNVVFYGPIGASKTFLAKKLAKCVQHKEELVGHNCNIYVVTLSPGFTRQELVNFLIDKGCLMRAGFQADSSETPIVLFDDVSKISVSEVFKDLLGVLENRGPNNPVKISLEDGKEPDAFYLVPSCYIICTMDRSKRTGELSIQQHFRWVHLRNDVEPMKGLLPRHLFRKLLHRHGGHIPPADGSVHRAVEWVICVWQRLNEGLAKLGLSDIILGPAPFLSCPIEEGKPKSILKWLSLLWNHTIAPSVSAAVIKGSGSDHLSGGQQKVANTALYVLMQRAIVSGCPLSGQEKERYLAGFNGSNELDIKMRPKGESLSSPLTPTGDSNPLEALISGQNRSSDVESPSENKENKVDTMTNITVNVEDTAGNNLLTTPEANKRSVSPRTVRGARSVSPRQNRAALDTSRNRSASPRLVLEQPRSSSPFHNKNPSGRSTSKKPSADGNSISSEMTSTTIAASVKAASALMQRDYLKEIASPKVVSPTRLRKLGNNNKPGSADSAEETQVRQDM